MKTQNLHNSLTAAAGISARHGSAAKRRASAFVAYIILLGTSIAAHAQSNYTVTGGDGGNNMTVAGTSVGSAGYVPATAGGDGSHGTGGALPGLQQDGNPGIGTGGGSPGGTTGDTFSGTQQKGGDGGIYTANVPGGEYGNFTVTGGKGGGGLSYQVTGGSADPSVYGGAGGAAGKGGSGGSNSGGGGGGGSAVLTASGAITAENIALSAGRGGGGGTTFNEQYGAGGGGGGGNVTLDASGQTVIVSGGLTLTSGVNGTDGMTTWMPWSKQGKGGAGGNVSFKAGVLQAPTITLNKKDGNLTFDVDTLRLVSPYTVFVDAGSNLGAGSVYIPNLLLTDGTATVGDGGIARFGRLAIDGGTLAYDVNWWNLLGRTYTDSEDINLGAGGVTLYVGATEQTLSRKLTGSGGVTMNAHDFNGKLTLSGANTYTGGTTVTAGNLVVGSATALGTGTVTLDATATNARTTLIFGGSYTLANNFVLNGDVTFDTGGNNVVLSGSVSGTGTLTVIGGGSLTMTGSASGAGTLTLKDGGTLKVGANTLANTDLIIENGVFDISGVSGTSANVKSVTVPDRYAARGTLTLGGKTLNITNNLTATNGEVRLGLDSSGTINVGGAFVTGSNTLLDITSAPAYGVTNTLVTASGGITGTFYSTLITVGGEAIAYSDYSYIDAVNVAVDGTGKKLQIIGAGLAWNRQTNAHGTFRIYEGSTFTVTDDLADRDPGTFTAFDYYGWDGKSLKKEYAGTLVLSGNNTYTGETWIQNGTLAGNIPENTQLLLSSVYDGLGQPRSVGILYGGGTVVNTVGFTVTGYENIRSNFARFPGSINASNAGGLTKVGSSDTYLLLTGTNSYSGGTRVEGGTLWGNIPEGGDLYVAADALYVGDNGFYNTEPMTYYRVARSVGELTGEGTIGYTDGFTVQSGTFNGIIDNTNTALTKTGAGTLTLTTSNTYTGATTVNGGTLALGTSGMIGAGGLTLNSGATFDITAAPKTISSLTATDATIYLGVNTLNVSGNAAINGGSINTTVTLNVGEYFDAIVASGTLSSENLPDCGAYTAVVYNGNTLRITNPALAITTDALPNGTVGWFYNETLTAAGTKPITWSVYSGALPDGLTLSSAGVISGRATMAGTFNFTVKASNGVTADQTQALSIEIGIDSDAPTLSAGSVNRTSDTEAKIGFTTDEAGTAYYLAVDGGADEPTIEEIINANQSLGFVNETVSGIAVTLEAGAKDIYVVLVDVAGNISNLLKIPAEVYVAYNFQVSNGNFFDSLADAAANVPEGGTITMLKDVSVSISYITLAAEATYTLDLGGHTLSNAGELMITAGTVTIKNGMVNNTKSNGLALRVGPYADVTIESGTYTSGICAIYCMGMVTIVSGQFSSVTDPDNKGCLTTATSIPTGITGQIVLAPGSVASVYPFVNVAGATNVTVTGGDLTAPTLSAGTVNRTSDITATIGFTTSEVGTAYYLVVNSGAAAPTNTAVKAGTSLGSVSAGAVSGLSVILTAGAKDIYVVVENSQYNISTPLKIEAAPVIYYNPGDIAVIN
ncbi:MAG: autotransporter-associated beta strand repeat-containing protein, partial [Tannerella sp.]|nr:autotransporter-associated beta strand repeat-containing protein [Tannerella sp.]